MGVQGHPSRSRDGTTLLLDRGHWVQCWTRADSQAPALWSGTRTSSWIGSCCPASGLCGSGRQEARGARTLRVLWLRTRRTGRRVPTAPCIAFERVEKEPCSGPKCTG